MPSPPDSTQRIPELDGLRGVAILSFLVYHYLEQQGPTTANSLTHFAQRLVLMGWSGVDLFFVLSGFLIGGILLNAQQSQSYFSTFYARRLFRIMPIYYFWISAYVLIVLLASGLLLRHSNSGVLPRPDFFVYAHYLFLQNLILFPYAGVAGAWFSHLWSLAVEEHFYLVSPVLIHLVSDRVLKIFWVAVMTGAPLLRAFLRFGTTIDRQLITAMMPCRADALAIGILAAMLWRNQSSREWVKSHLAAGYAKLGVCGLGVAALWKWSPESNTSGMQITGLSCLAFFYAALLLLGDVVARSGPRILLHVHHPPGDQRRFAHVPAACPPSTTSARGLLVTIATGFATYAGAWISWHVIEHPLVRRGHAFRY